MLKVYTPSIIAGVQKVLDGIQAKLVEAGVQTFVHIPVLYPLVEHGAYGTPNAVNMQVIDGGLLIPLQPLPSFTTEIEKNLKAAGVAKKSIIFVDTTQLDASHGEAHCASNVQREPYPEK